VVGCSIVSRGEVLWERKPVIRDDDDDDDDDLSEGWKMPGRSDNMKKEQF
jgi:hypothetical protein